MLLIKAAIFIIYTYILLITSYVELILSKSLGKFHSSLINTVLKADRNYLSEYNFQHYYVLSNLGLWDANKVVYL